MLKEGPAFVAYNDLAATFTPTLYAYHYLLIGEAQLAGSEFFTVLVDLSLTWVFALLSCSHHKQSTFYLILIEAVYFNDWHFIIVDYWLLTVFLSLEHSLLVFFVSSIVCFSINLFFLSFFSIFILINQLPMLFRVSWSLTVAKKDPIVLPFASITVSE